MARVSGDALGRWSLRIDAAYCLLLGFGVAICSHDVAVATGFPPAFVAVAGVAVVLWACVVTFLLVRTPLRRALLFVMVANAGAALAVACMIPAAISPIAQISIATIAADIALFATSQAMSLSLLRQRVPLGAKVSASRDA